MRKYPHLHLLEKEIKEHVEISKKSFDDESNYSTKETLFNKVFATENHIEEGIPVLLEEM